MYIYDSCSCIIVFNTGIAIVCLNLLKPRWWFGFNALSNIIRKNVRILVWFIRPGMCVGAD